jgi:hypothetical protein
MRLSHALSVLIAILTLAIVTALPPISSAQVSSDLIGDPERGRVVFRSIGYCVSCHGWAGDGKSGTNLQAPIGPNLRETGLDRAALLDVIGCGRPGTPMPYHDRAAYRDGRCSVISLADFAVGMAPVRGKVFSDRDVGNVVAFLEAYIIGRGEPTYEECAAFYANPSAAACSGMD